MKGTWYKGAVIAVKIGEAVRHVKNGRVAVPRDLLKKKNHLYLRLHTNKAKKFLSKVFVQFFQALVLLSK